METLKKGEELLEAFNLLDGEVTVPFIVVESLMERHEQEKVRMRAEHEKTIKHMKNIVNGTRFACLVIVLSIFLGIVFICSTYSFRTVDVEQHTGEGGNNTYTGGDYYGDTKSQNSGTEKQKE